MSGSFTETTPVEEPQITIYQRKVVLLAGGTAGAALATGLARLLPPDHLAIVVNTGNDFQHLGLTICPDLDAVLHSLASLSAPEPAGGPPRRRLLEEIGRLGGPTWFPLADRQVATCLVRAHLLAEGHSLTEVTDTLRRHLGVSQAVLPMSNEPAPTLLKSDDGLVALLPWFFGQPQASVNGIRLPENIKTTAEVLRVIEQCEMLIFAPDNPFLAIDPILNVYPLRALITDLPELVMAVAPMPADLSQTVAEAEVALSKRLGLEVAPVSVGHHYQEHIDAFVYYRQDGESLAALDVEQLQLEHPANDRAGYVQLARQIMVFAEELLNR
jgi:LPPG:FO 2-phospho-L-lactate transferase